MRITIGARRHHPPRYIPGGVETHPPWDPVPMATLEHGQSIAVLLARQLACHVSSVDEAYHVTPRAGIDAKEVRRVPLYCYSCGLMVYCKAREPRGAPGGPGGPRGAQGGPGGPGGGPRGALGGPGAFGSPGGTRKAQGPGREPRRGPGGGAGGALQISLCDTLPKSKGKPIDLESKSMHLDQIVLGGTLGGARGPGRVPEGVQTDRRPERTPQAGRRQHSLDAQM